MASKTLTHKPTSADIVNKGAVAVYWETAKNSGKYTFYELPMCAKEGLTVSKETIWNSTATRNSKGKWTGSIVAKKWKIEMKWNTITRSQAKDIYNASLTKASFSVLFMSMSGTYNVATFYLGTNTAFTHYSNVAGKQYIRDVSVHYIEV